MRRHKAMLITFLAFLCGFLVLERVFLGKLKTSVINDDQKIAEFLATLTYPINIQSSFGFCRDGGSSWGYTYKLCLQSGAIPPNCPKDALELQYLGPQNRLSLISKEYHSVEPQFRTTFAYFDRNGVICEDRRRSSK